MLKFKMKIRQIKTKVKKTLLKIQLLLKLTQIKNPNLLLIPLKMNQIFNLLSPL
jgi:hypothetical protein